VGDRIIVRNNEIKHASPTIKIILVIPQSHGETYFCCCVKS